MEDDQPEGAHPELRHESDGPRFYLAGLPMHAGDKLHVLADDGSWVLGRYEYSWDRFTSSFTGRLFIGDRTVPVSETTTLRWPTPERPRFKNR